MSCKSKTIFAKKFHLFDKLRLCLSYLQYPVNLEDHLLISLQVERPHTEVFYTNPSLLTMRYAVDSEIQMPYLFLPGPCHCKDFRQAWREEATTSRCQ